MVRSLFQNQIRNRFYFWEYFKPLEYLKCFFVYFFSQVEPTPNNHAANMLSHEIQIRNVRKVMINAQITFGIYVLECVANTSIYVVWAFVSGTSNNVTLGLAIVWYHIILPYTFLVNTSNNKNLVTDDGWWNTIRTTLGLDRKVDTSSRQSKSSKINHVELGNESIHRKKSNESNFTDSTDIEMNAKKKDNIFIVSDAKHLQPSFSGISKPVSNRRSEDDNNRMPLPVKRQISISQLKVKSFDSDAEDQTPRNRYLWLGQTLFSLLEQYINKEEVYLHYLRQIAKLDKTKNEKETSLIEFEILHFSNIPRPKIGKIKQSKKTTLDKPYCRIENDTPKSPSKNRPIDLGIPDKVIAGHISERIEARRSLINDFKDYCNDEKSFQTFCNLVLDFEESLVRV